MHAVFVQILRSVLSHVCIVFTPMFVPLCDRVISFDDSFTPVSVFCVFIIAYSLKLLVIALHLHCVLVSGSVLLLRLH